MSNQTYINQDGQAPRVNYNLIGGGAIDYNDHTLLKLFKFFEKYEHVVNSEIVETYKEYKEWIQKYIPVPNTVATYETVKQTIIHKYGIVIQEKAQEVVLLDDSTLDDEPENENDNDDDSDDEYVIPAGAEIIEMDEYEEPEIVELKKLKVEPGTENKKRKNENTACSLQEELGKKENEIRRQQEELERLNAEVEKLRATARKYRDMKTQLKFANDDVDLLYDAWVKETDKNNELEKEVKRLRTTVDEFKVKKTITKPVSPRHTFKKQ